MNLTSEEAQKIRDAIEAGLSSRFQNPGGPDFLCSYCYADEGKGHKGDCDGIAALEILNRKE